MLELPAEVPRGKSWALHPLDSELPLRSITNLPFDETTLSIAVPITARSCYELQPTITSACGQGVTGNTARRSPRIHFSLKLVLVVSYCTFIIVPSLTLWLSAWQLWVQGIHRTSDVSHWAIQDLSLDYAEGLLFSSQQYYQGLHDRSHSLMLYFVSRLRQSRLIEAADGTSTDTITGHILDMATVNELILSMVHTVKVHPRVFGLSISVRYINARCEGAQSSFTVSRFPFDVLSGNLTSAEMAMVYLMETEQIAFSNGSVASFGHYMTTTISNVYVIDQLTAERLYRLPDAEVPEEQIPKMSSASSTQNQNGSTHAHHGGSLSAFCEVTNQIMSTYPVPTPEAVFGCQFPIAEGRAVARFQMIVYLKNVLDTILQSQVSGPKDRVFLYFPDSQGSLMGATHGQLFWHKPSEQDDIMNPNVSFAFQWLSALNSTDPIIRSAGEWLIDEYKDWGLVPELNTTHVINGDVYWVLSRLKKYADPSSGAMHGNFHLFVLAHRATRMGPIDEHVATVLADIEQNNRRFLALISGVVVLALMLALALAFALSRFLHRLTQGLDSLCALQFLQDRTRGKKRKARRSLLSGSRGPSLGDRCVVFSEVATCESSFSAMQRGLNAFAKYVSEEVVRLIFAGEMRLDLATQREVTVLFMDIAKFSTLSETIPIDSLVDVTTEYLQNMCEIIVSTGGFLDKFIGDCIMAIWNAPSQLDEHERAACEAAIAMQGRLIVLSEDWSRKTSAEIRFRIGINSDRLYVGNFGCKYRIAFTCVGDGVNVASWLEAANKEFHTVVLVHEQTQRKAARAFYFRKIAFLRPSSSLGLIVDPIFELLCRRPHSNSNTTTTTTELGNERTVSFSPQMSAVEMVGSPSMGPENGNGKRHHNGGGAGNHYSVGSDDHSDPERSRSVGSSTFGTDGTKILFHWEWLQERVVLEMAQLFEKGIECLRVDELDGALDWFSTSLATLPMDETSRRMFLKCNEAKHKRDTSPTELSPQCSSSPVRRPRSPFPPKCGVTNSCLFTELMVVAMN